MGVFRRVWPISSTPSHPSPPSLTRAVPRPIILRYFVDIAVAKTVDNRKFTLGDKWPAYPELPHPTNHDSYFCCSFIVFGLLLQKVITGEISLKAHFHSGLGYLM